MLDFEYILHNIMPVWNIYTNSQVEIKGSYYMVGFVC